MKKLRKCLFYVFAGVLLIGVICVTCLLFLPIQIAWAINFLAPEKPLHTRVESAIFRFNHDEEFCEISINGAILTESKTRKNAAEISNIKIQIPKDALFEKRLLPTVEITGAILDADAFLALNDTAEKTELPTVEELQKITGEILEKLRENFRDDNDTATLKIADIAVKFAENPPQKITQISAKISRLADNFSLDANVALPGGNTPAGAIFSVNATAGIFEKNATMLAQMTPLEIPADLLAAFAPEHAENLPAPLKKLVVNFSANAEFSLADFTVKTGAIAATARSDFPENNPALNTEIAAKIDVETTGVIFEECEFRLEDFFAVAHDFKIKIPSDSPGSPLTPTTSGKFEIGNFNLEKLSAWIPEKFHGEIENLKLPPVEISSATIEIATMTYFMEKQLDIWLPASSLTFKTGETFSATGTRLIFYKAKDGHFGGDIDGDLATSTVNGTFAQPFLPPEILEKLQKFNISPKDFFLKNGTAHGNVTFLLSGKISDFLPLFTIEIQAEFQEKPVEFKVSLDYRHRFDSSNRPVIPGTLFFFAFEMAPLNPSHFDLEIPAEFNLPAGVSLATFDTPLSTTIYAHLDEKFTPLAGEIFVHGTDGVILATPLYNVEVPFKELSLYAKISEKFQKISDGNFVFETDCAKFFGKEISVDLTSVPFEISGILHAHEISFPEAFRFLPENIFPEYRELLLNSIQSANVEQTYFSFFTKLDPKNLAATRPEELHGSIEITPFRGMAPLIEEPVSFTRITVEMDYPNAEISLINGGDFNPEETPVFVDAAKISIENFDSENPKISITGKFGANLAKSAKWLEKLQITPPENLPVSPEKMRGSIFMNLDAAVPLKKFSPDLKNVTANAKLNFSHVEIPWKNADWETRFSENTEENSVLIIFQNDTALANFDFQNFEIKIPDLLGGAVSATGEICANFEKDLISANVASDLSGAKILRRGMEKMTPPNSAASVEIRDALGKNQVSFFISNDAAELFGLPFGSNIRGEIDRGNLRLMTPMEMSATLGKTHFEIEMAPLDLKNFSLENQKIEVAIKNGEIDFPEIIHWAEPLVDAFAGQKSAEKPVEKNGTDASPLDFFMPVKDARLKFNFSKIDLGGGAILRNANGGVDVREHAFHGLQFTAVENLENGISTSVSLKNDRNYAVRLTMNDTFAWARAVSFPVSILPILESKMRENLSAQLRDSAKMFKGGELDLNGILAPDGASVSFDGSAKFENLLMLEAPYFLRLLALKTKKTLQEKPLLEVVEIPRAFYKMPFGGVENVEIAGSGLVDLSLTKAAMDLTNEKIQILGKYYGIPFEILGTREKPEIYLQETETLKIITTQDELYFGFEDE